jgi:hypothetical protein
MRSCGSRPLGRSRPNRKISPRAEIDPAATTSAPRELRVTAEKAPARILFNAAGFLDQHGLAAPLTRLAPRPLFKSKIPARAKTRQFQPSELLVMVESPSRRPGSLGSAYGSRLNPAAAPHTGGNDHVGNPKKARCVGYSIAPTDAPSHARRRRCRALLERLDAANQLGNIALHPV